MPRWTGTTAERGYGNNHRQERERRLAAYRPGDTCAHGGEQMVWWPLAVARLYLDLPHTDDRSGYLPGLACRQHNRADGASRSNGAKLVRAARPGDVRCKTCGQTYNYAARSCAICGKHYHPNRKDQRSCSRACGVELRRRLYGTAGRKLPKPKPSPKPRAPGPVASGQREPKNGWPSVAVEAYTCRYCGELGVRRSKPPPNHGLREVCGSRICHLAQLQANNLRLRKGISKQEADAQMAELVASAMARRRPSTEGNKNGRSHSG